MKGHKYLVVTIRRDRNNEGITRRHAITIHRTFEAARDTADVVAVNTTRRGEDVKIIVTEDRVTGYTVHIAKDFKQEEV